jgi:acetyl esterase
MALNPQAKALLDMMASAEAPELWSLSPEEARAQMLAMRQDVEKPPVAKVEDRTILAGGDEIPVRIYTPEGDGPFPALVFYHGGGWVLGDIEYADIACRLMANDAGCVVVSVEYRLAPEHKFPTPLHDCYAALEWVVSNAGMLKVDTNRVAVGGDSAGGNLAAAVSIKARDEDGPKLVHQLLVYPVTDHSFETGSYGENADGYMLTRTAMEWFWNHYLNGPEDSENHLVSPLRVADASRLPSATVITAEFDPLRDEGEAYAKKLEAAGVPVTVRRWDGQIHGFFQMSTVLEDGKAAVDFASKQLKQAFSGTTA